MKFFQRWKFSVAPGKNGKFPVKFFDNRSVPGTIWRHRKGGHYMILGSAVRERDRSCEVIYRCQQSGIVYTRPAAEFFDGRFKRVAGPVSPSLPLR